MPETLLITLPHRQLLLIRPVTAPHIEHRSSVKSILLFFWLLWRMVRSSWNMELIQTLALSDHLKHTSIIQHRPLPQADLWRKTVFVFSMSSFSLLLNNRTGHQVLLARLIRTIISSIEDKWTRGAPLPPAADMLISGKSRGPPVMSLCQSRLRSPRGPWKDLLHWVPVTEDRKESDFFGLTHNHFVSHLYLSPHLRFSLFLSITQSLYLYVVFGLHRSLFRGIHSLCAAQVMLAQMKQNGLFSPFPAFLWPLSLNLIFFLSLFLT